MSLRPTEQLNQNVARQGQMQFHCVQNHAARRRMAGAMQDAKVTAIRDLIAFIEQRSGAKNRAA